MAESESRTTSEPERTLKSEQIPGNEMFRNLVREYYAPVFRLALATLHETETAQRATVRTFVSALHDIHHTRSRESIRLWLFSLALRIIRDEERRQHRQHGTQTSPEAWETRLWRMVDALGAKEHELCVLHYLLGCRISESSSLLHVSQSAVHAQLEIFRVRFRQILGETTFSSSGEDVAPEITGAPPSKGRSVDLLRTIEARVAGSLQRRWPAPQLSSSELEQVIDQIKLLAERERTNRQQTAPYKRLALAGGMVILAAICLSWGILAWLSSSRQATSISQATEWEVKPGSPLEKVKELTKRSDPETIRQRIKEGPLLWKTLWIDVQIITYGPQSYAGLPKTYRAQAWISQPDQSRELFGLLSEAPSSVSMVEEGASFYINPTLKLAYSEEWKGNPPKEYSGGKLLANAALRDMVFPGSGDLRSGKADERIGIIGGIGSTWVKGDGTFNTLKYERIADRRALVIDWMNSENKRETRLWLDVQTGLILRLQEYGGADFQTLTYESIVTEIAYNQSSPPPRLSEPVDLKEPDTILELETTPMVQETTIPTPTIALPLVNRLSIYPETAPVGFDPSHSSLVFQFPLDPGIMNSITNTAEIPSGLIADGYLLGVIKFGLPWVLRCNRSPDGQRLAFNTRTDGTAPADDSLRWFNLKEPQAIYQPLPRMHATSFVFAPDNHRLAVFGYGGKQWESGIYILDIGTGEYEFLINLVDASSLVWSPDGIYLALIGSTLEDDEPAVLVIHVDTAQIAYQAEIEFQDSVTYSGKGPMMDWGVKFPVEMGGMDECAAPP